jgi:hypothetical protein
MDVAKTLFFHQSNDQLALSQNSENTNRGVVDLNPKNYV